MLYRRAFYRRRKPQRLFKIAVSDLHLLIRDSADARTVLATAGNGQSVALNIDLDLLSRNARQLNLNDPTIGRLINVRRRVPKLTRSDVL